MTPSSALPSSKRPTGLAKFVPHWIPMIFVGAFLTVIAVNGALIFFAEKTFSGLDTASPYERGLEYNKTLAAEAAQERLGWQYEASISGENDTGHNLWIRMKDRDGRPLDGLKMEAYLMRPSNEGSDVRISPQPAGDGFYVASFALPAPGQWELRVVARGDSVWQHSQRLFVK